MKGPTQLAVYFYNYRIDDLIERYSDADGLLLLPQSRQRPHPRIRSRGPHGAAGRTSRVEVGANIGRGEALDDDVNLDDISPDTFSLLVRKDFGRTGVRADARRVPRRRRSPRSERGRSRPGATLIDLAGGFRFAKYLELRANARNLLDDAYYASPDPRWV